MVYSKKDLDYMKKYMEDKTTVAIPVELRNRIRNLREGRETMTDVIKRAIDTIDPDIEEN